MNDKHGSQQDIVDRAVGALRQTHVPASCPPEGLAARLTEAEALEAVESPRFTIRRIFTMKHKSKIAAAAAAAAIVIVVTMLTIGSGSATIAWADVQEKIRNARTMTCKMKVKTEGSPTMEMTMMLKEPGSMRMEMTMGPVKVITITDMQQGKMITLVDAQKKKTATITDLTGITAEARKEKEEQDFLAGIKELIEESETELGDKTIDGRVVKGYRVEKDNQVITIWADAETAEPVEMKMTMFQGEVETTMSDFKFDVELDDSLFSMEVPKGQGYTVDKVQMKIKKPSAADLVEMLRLFAEMRGGTFPDALTPSRLTKDAMDFAKAAKEGKLEYKALAEEMAKEGGRELTFTIARAMTLVGLHSEAHYAGKGVKRGDAKTPIFWYKPNDSETYKVIYGDLRIEDVAPEDLPKPPEEANTPE